MFCSAINITAFSPNVAFPGCDQIFSGTVHYFRIHPAYWRTTLRKLRAAGLNTVETYVAWNLHEPQMDVYDFGDGGNDMSEFLDLAGGSSCFQVW